MRALARAALRPNNEAPRQPGQAERGTINLVIHDADADTTAARRIQYLGRRFELPTSLAQTIAALAFGGARG